MMKARNVTWTNAYASKVSIPTVNAISEAAIAVASQLSDPSTRLEYFDSRRIVRP
jgi:hypothetical protein